MHRPPRGSRTVTSAVEQLVVAAPSSGFRYSSPWLDRSDPALSTFGATISLSTTARRVRLLRQGDGRGVRADRRLRPAQFRQPDAVGDPAPNTLVPGTTRSRDRRLDKQAAVAAGGSLGSTISPNDVPAPTRHFPFDHRNCRLTELMVASPLTPIARDRAHRPRASLLPRPGPVPRRNVLTPVTQQATFMGIAMTSSNPSSTASVSA